MTHTFILYGYPIAEQITVCRIIAFNSITQLAQSLSTLGSVSGCWIQTNVTSQRRTHIYMCCGTRNPWWHQGVGISVKSPQSWPHCTIIRANPMRIYINLNNTEWAAAPGISILVR